MLRTHITSTNIQEPVTLEQTQAAMLEVAYGDKQASVKLAWWASALSCQIKLPVTCKHTRVMAQFVDRPLPPMPELIDIMGGDSETWLASNGHKGFPTNCTGQIMRSLYAIEQLFNDGLIDFECGNTLESQQAWRSRMVDLIPGLACKLVSWALFIYSPFDCKLLTIDTWHCRRLGLDQTLIAGSSVCKKAAYHKVEAAMLGECLGYAPHVAPVITAAMLWENIRRANGASDTVEYTSHRGISCRWY